LSFLYLTTVNFLPLTFKLTITLQFLPLFLPTTSSPFIPLVVSPKRHHDTPSHREDFPAPLEPPSSLFVPSIRVRPLFLKEYFEETERKTRGQGYIYFENSIVNNNESRTLANKDFDEAFNAQTDTDNTDANDMNSMNDVFGDNTDNTDTSDMNNVSDVFGEDSNEKETTTTKNTPDDMVDVNNVFGEADEATKEQKVDPMEKVEEENNKTPESPHNSSKIAEITSDDLDVGMGTLDIVEDLNNQLNEEVEERKDCNQKK